MIQATYIVAMHQSDVHKGKHSQAQIRQVIRKEAYPKVDKWGWGMEREQGDGKGTRGCIVQGKKEKDSALMRTEASGS